MSPHFVTLALVVDHLMVFVLLSISFYIFNHKLRRHVFRELRDNFGDCWLWQSMEKCVSGIKKCCFSNAVSPEPPGQAIEMGHLPQQNQHQQEVRRQDTAEVPQEEAPDSRQQQEDKSSEEVPECKESSPDSSPKQDKIDDEEMPEKDLTECKQSRPESSSNTSLGKSNGEETTQV